MIVAQFIFIGLFSLLFVLYLGAVIFTNRIYKKWPLYRSVCWCAGLIVAAVSVAGPLAHQAHADFTLHMVSHLLLGMLAPLLLVLAAPMTLLLRTLPTKQARIVTKLMKSGYVRIVINPIVAAVLHMGGLWLLYTTTLYSLMHENSFVYFFVHLHILLAAYVFTASLIAVDPIFYRKSFLYRALTLIIALASHSILAKYIYAYPPEGVPIKQAEEGAILMYYGGDLIDAVIILILCMQWFKATAFQVKRLAS